MGDQRRSTYAKAPPSVAASTSSRPPRYNQVPRDMSRLPDMLMEEDEENQIDDILDNVSSPNAGIAQEVEAAERAIHEFEDNVRAEEENEDDPTVVWEGQGDSSATVSMPPPSVSRPSPARSSQSAASRVSSQPSASSAPSGSSPRPQSSRPSSSSIWTHFEKMINEPGKALCKHCDEKVSFQINIFISFVCHWIMVVSLDNASIFVADIAQHEMSENGTLRSCFLRAVVWTMEENNSFWISTLKACCRECVV